MSVYDRELAGFAPSEAHFRAHLPRDLEAIGYFKAHPNAIPDAIIKQYLPEFTQRMMNDEMLMLLARRR